MSAKEEIENRKIENNKSNIRKDVISKPVSDRKGWVSSTKIIPKTRKSEIQARFIDSPFGLTNAKKNEKEESEKEVRDIVAQLLKRDIKMQTSKSIDDIKKDVMIYDDEETEMIREEEILKSRAAQLKHDAERLKERKMALRLRNLQDGLQSRADKELAEYKKTLLTESEGLLLKMQEERDGRMSALKNFQTDLESKISHLQRLCEDVNQKKEALQKGYKEVEIKVIKDIETKVEDRRKELKESNISRLKEAAVSMGYKQQM